MSSKCALFTMSVFVALWVVPGSAQDKKFEMAPIKYAGLKQEILKHRGKIVLVDFWAGY